MNAQRLLQLGWMGLAVASAAVGTAVAATESVPPASTGPAPTDAAHAAPVPEDAAHAMPADGASIDFNRDIRPILNERCFHCHGPDEKSRKARLRLDDRENVVDKKEAILPGNPDESELILRVLSQDPDDMMPPPETHQKITPAEVEKLKRWVKQGAKYSGHWSFTNPVLPPVPATPEGVRVANPIDAFVATKALAAGLAQSPPADRGMLLRRVSLDLTGVPPTPDAVAEFVADSSPTAYEAAVDRLLASPQYGERWARVWLDLARYADSTGYGMDVLRPYMWPYRSWVINAYNRNLPFDQFTVDQLAGDLLPNPTQDQLVATAFHRNTPANMEGGTPDEEYRVAAVKDRANTTVQVWMGLTMGCAQCHTHKFDPITHADYYSTFAIFNQSADADLADEEPRLTLNVEPAEVESDVAKLKTRIAELEKEIEKTEAEYQAKKLAAKKAEPAKEPAAGDAHGPAKSDETASGDKPAEAPVVAAGSGAAPQPAAAGTNKQRTLLKKLKDQLATVTTVKIPVMRDLPADKARKSHILLAGSYLVPGDEVQPAVLGSFGSKVEGTQDRLALARWLTDAENPLTARVTVNRYWAQLFGRGLVETEEDFGTQGALPTHPELLDWLAVTFRTPKAEGGLGWDMKALLKVIVTSETYRQSSVASQVAIEKDPRNELLSYYPRRRLDAEGLRDQALALAGLLSDKLGGPSVFPPQPEGLWQVSFNGGSKSEYVTSVGEERHRRGVYTIWRRIAPHPAMTTLDAPARDVCSIRRQPTNTPLQAFVLMNDPQFVEAAQGMARRILTEGGETVDSKLRYAVELCTARPAKDEDLSVLRQTYDAELAAYQADPAAATKAASEPLGPLPAGLDPAEAAAMTSVSTVLLNLDAVLTKN